MTNEPFERGLVGSGDIARGDARPRANLLAPTPSESLLQLEERADPTCVPTRNQYADDNVVACSRPARQNGP